MVKQTKHLYNILFVSGEELFISKMKSLVPTENFNAVASVTSLHEAEDLLKSSSFDIIVLKFSTPCKIKEALEFFRQLPTALLLITDEKHYGALYEQCTSNGVALIKQGSADLFFREALQMLCAEREKVCGIEMRATTAEGKAEEMKIINRAKWLLVSQLKMTEPQAHKFIEKQAMNRCVTKRTIAENILSAYK